jgi:hypothetical protein
MGMEWNGKNFALIFCGMIGSSPAERLMAATHLMMMIAVGMDGLMGPLSKR